MARRPVSEDAMLDKMSVDELMQLRSSIDAMVTHKRTDGRKRLMETMSEEAKKHGFDINELFGSILVLFIAYRSTFANHLWT